MTAIKVIFAVLIFLIIATSIALNDYEFLIVVGAVGCLFVLGMTFKYIIHACSSTPPTPGFDIAAHGEEVIIAPNQPDDNWYPFG